MAKLDAPDDALLAALLVKHFADRQVAVPPGLIDYLVPRIERSSAAAEAVVAALDRAGLAGPAAADAAPRRRGPPGGARRE